MDRFIVQKEQSFIKTKSSLKSNMDRFIERGDKCTFKAVQPLKSNMDRFIEIRQAVQEH